MLTIARFATLVESYGASLQRWPQDMRRDADALLADSSDARRLLAEAHVLDQALQVASAREDLAIWQPGEQDAALARLRNGIAARAAAPARKPLTHWRAPFTMPSGWIGMAVSGGVAIVAGLIIGSTALPRPPQLDLLAMLQASSVPILAD